MMNKTTQFITYLLTGLLITATSAYAGGGDGHNDEDNAEHAEENSKGPQGGKLLADGDFAVEISIYESGVPPEMRLYAYDHGKPVAVNQWQVSVTLNRLGGEQDNIAFSPEMDYQLGDQVIREPHSYDVTVSASYNNQQYQWQYDNHEGRTMISDRQLQLAGVKTERANPALFSQEETLFGVIAPEADKLFRINAPYPGLVETVHVNVGDKVTKGQRLVSLLNTNTLQRYDVNSPSSGEITERLVNKGDRAEQGALLELVDLSTVWVEMSAFPESIEQLALGQTVIVSDLHHHEAAKGVIEYIAPQMTGGHIARTRTSINNAEGHWRPGMHVKSKVQTSSRNAPLVIKASAVQSFREMPVVFAKYGNTFEVRMVELGEKSGDSIEVLGGLKPGTEYVTENSFLIKADILKDGASHDH